MAQKTRTLVRDGRGRLVRSSTSRHNPRNDAFLARKWKPAHAAVHRAGRPPRPTWDVREARRRAQRRAQLLARVAKRRLHKAMARATYLATRQMARHTDRGRVKPNRHRRLSSRSWRHA